MKLFKHKKTGTEMRLLKEGKTFSTFIDEKNPTKKFYNQTISNRHICRNKNMKEVV